MTYALLPTRTVRASAAWRLKRRVRFALYGMLGEVEQENKSVRLHCEGTGGVEPWVQCVVYSV